MEFEIAIRHFLDSTVRRWIL